MMAIAVMACIMVFILESRKEFKNTKEYKAYIESIKHLNMAEYVWTFYIFNLRIGWMKYKVNNFYKSDGYLSLGKLDFYIDKEY